jgi:hypothetical protein
LGAAASSAASAAIAASSCAVGTHFASEARLSAVSTAASRRSSACLSTGAFIRSLDRLIEIMFERFASSAARRRLGSEAFASPGALETAALKKRSARPKSAAESAGRWLHGRRVHTEPSSSRGGSLDQ